LNIGGVLLLEFCAGCLLILILGIELFIRLQPQLGACLHSWLISLGPVDHANRIIGFGIIGVDLKGFTIVRFGVFKLLHLQIDVGDSLDTVDALGVALQHCLILIDSLLSQAVIVFGINSWNVLLSIGGSQIETSID